MSSPDEFLKCPDCHRSTTVSLTIHADGDGSIKCSACGAYAGIRKLHQSDRMYGGVDEQ